MPAPLEINGRLPYILIGETQVGKSVGNRCIRRFDQRDADPHTTTYTAVERMSLVLTQDEIEASLPPFNQMLSEHADPTVPTNPFHSTIPSLELNPTWGSVGWQAYDELSDGGKKSVDDIRARLGYPAHSVDGKKFIFLDMISAEVAGQSDFDAMLERYVTTNADAIFDLGLVIGAVIDTTDPSTVPAARVKNDLVKMGLDAGLGDGTYQDLSRSGKLIHFIYENKCDLPSRITPEARQGLKKTLETPYYHKTSFKTDAHDKTMAYLICHPVIAYNNSARIGGWL